jgi:hypothetical protein
MATYKKKPLTEEEFNQKVGLFGHLDREEKKAFGTYDNYLNNFYGDSAERKAGATDAERQDKFHNPSAQKTSTPITNQPSTAPTTNGGYTMQDVVSVDQTGELPKVEEKPKSVYDTYMEEARNIYNQNVEDNNKAAANQAAIAGAQYRELNRNIGELNKANGRANTGYAGDTSIDAYNAYRNSVNASYSNANKANNDLYSYYLSEVANLQQAKENKEYQDKQLEWQEREYNDKKETDILGEALSLIETNSNGYITAESANNVYNYLSSMYGGAENIPETTLGKLNTQKGFSEWLNEYNSGNTKDYNQFTQPIVVGNVSYIDKEGNATNKGKGGDFSVLETEMGASPYKDRYGDDMAIKFNGETYRLQSGEKLEGKIANSILSMIAEAKGRNAQGGDVFFYDGNIYFVCDDNKTIRKAEERSWTHGGAYDRLVKDVKGKLNIR